VSEWGDDAACGIRDLAGFGGVSLCVRVVLVLAAVAASLLMSSLGW